MNVAECRQAGVLWFSSPRPLFYRRTLHSCNVSEAFAMFPRNVDLHQLLTALACSCVSWTWASLFCVVGMGCLSFFACLRFLRRLKSLHGVRKSNFPCLVACLWYAGCDGVSNGPYVRSSTVSTASALSRVNSERADGKSRRASPSPLPSNAVEVLCSL